MTFSLNVNVLIFYLLYRIILAQTHYKELARAHCLDDAGKKR